MACKKPCKQCPFRKTSLAGWLGDHSYRPQIFIDGMEYTILPCHMKTDWDEAEQRTMIVEGEKNPCVGALSFCANSLKIPRGARIEGVYKNLMDKAKSNPEVFKWQQDFIEHHSKK